MTNPFEHLEQKLSAIQESLKSIAESINQQSPPLRLYSRQEAAEMLHMTLPTLYSYTNKGLIKMSKVGRKSYYTEEALREALVEIQNDGR